MSIDNVSCRWYLISTAPPGQPRTVAVESIGATWVLICWDPPFIAESPISHYEITARPTNVDVAMVTVTTANSSCLLYTSPSPRDATLSRMPSSA